MRDDDLGLGAKRLTPGYNIAGFQPEAAATMIRTRQG
jgi:hypothetical protein